MAIPDLLKQFIFEVVSSKPTYRVEEVIGLVSSDGSTDTFSSGDTLVKLDDLGTHVTLYSQRTRKKYNVNKRLLNKSFSMSGGSSAVKKRVPSTLRGARRY